MSLEYLGLDETATEAQVNARFKEMAKSAHPDRGGTTEQFQRLKEAKDEALKELSFGQTLSRARIQIDALRQAARGAKCPRCDGTGQAMARKVGFRGFVVRCRLCKGTGRL